MASPFLDRDLNPYHGPPLRPSSSKAHSDAYDTPAIPLIVEMKGDDLADRASQEFSDHGDFEVMNQRDEVGVISYTTFDERHSDIFLKKCQFSDGD